MYLKNETAFSITVLAGMTLLSSAYASELKDICLKNTVSNGKLQKAGRLNNSRWVTHRARCDYKVFDTKSLKTHKITLMNLLGFKE